MRAARVLTEKHTSGWPAGWPDMEKKGGAAT